MAEYLGVLLIVVAALALCAAVLLVNRRLAPHRRLDDKLDAFASGGPVLEAPRRRFAVRPFAAALIFLIATAAVVLLHAWGAVVRELGSGALAGMAFFSAPLAVGLVYALARGVLRW